MVNKQRLIRQYTTFLTRKSKQHTPPVYRAIRGQIRYWAATQSLDLPSQPMYDALRDLYKDVGRLWAWQSYRNVLTDTKRGVKAAPLGINQYFINAILNYFNARLLEKVSDIEGTTRDWLIQEITRGEAESLSLDEITRNILSNTDIPKFRAERIARTESGIAANHAADIGAAKTGLELEKEWISVHDERTRHPHLNADGQTRDFDDPFNIGGFAMMRPGDSTTQNSQGLTAPASTIINCRCCLGHSAKRDSDGLPIMRTDSSLLVL